MLRVLKIHVSIDVYNVTLENSLSRIMNKDMSMISSLCVFPIFAEIA